MKVCEGLLRKRVDAKEQLVFACITESRTASTVEIFQAAGFDALMIDREHTSLNSETIADHVRVARSLDFPCMVRVCEDSYSELNRNLDQGADGIYVPRIKNRSQVENIVRTVRYKPLGIRGLGGYTCPISKYLGWGSVVDQIEGVNKNTVIGIQIETADALEDLDGILSVKGIDIAVVGSDDLSMGMGIPGQLKNPKFMDAVMRVIESCQKHGVVPGYACGDPELAAYWIDKGMRVIWYVNDAYLIYAGAIQQLGKLKDCLRRT